MKLSKSIILKVAGICLLFSILLLPISSKAQSPDNLQRGATVNGLQMSISTVASSKTNVPEFQVALRNVGEKDTTINLGIMLANGKKQEPDKIDFILTDANGKTHKFDFGSVMIVAGRVDDFIVPLRAGSIYTLRFSSEHFYSSGANESVSQLLSGKYKITAEFEGSGANHTNLDTPGVKLMNFWLGKLQSNDLTVER